MPNFTLIAFSSAVETLRMANLTSEQELYRWSVLTLDDAPATSSAALQIHPTLPFEQARKLDMIFVCAGVHVKDSWNPPLGRALRRLAGNLPLGALCTGTYLLAKSGVLNDHRCTIHWENIGSLREEFPQLKVTDELFEIDRRRYTCAGGTAPLDLMAVPCQKRLQPGGCLRHFRTVHHRPHQGTRRTSVYICAQPGSGARPIT